MQRNLLRRTLALGASAIVSLSTLTARADAPKEEASPSEVDVLLHDLRALRNHGALQAAKPEAFEALGADLGKTDVSESVVVTRANPERAAVHIPVQLPSRGRARRGRLSTAQIVNTIRAHRAVFRWCWESRSTGGGFAKVVLGFKIGPVGDVRDLKVIEAYGARPELEGCVQEMLRRIRFTRPHGGGSVRASHSFLFVDA